MPLRYRPTTYGSSWSSLRQRAVFVGPPMPGVIATEAGAFRAKLAAVAQQDAHPSGTDGAWPTTKCRRDEPVGQFLCACGPSHYIDAAILRYSSSVNARHVCVRTFPRAAVPIASFTTTSSLGASEIAT